MLAMEQHFKAWKKKDAETRRRRTKTVKKTEVDEEHEIEKKKLADKEFKGWVRTKEKEIKLKRDQNLLEESEETEMKLEKQLEKQSDAEQVSNLLY